MSYATRSRRVRQRPRTKRIRRRQDQPLLWSKTVGPVFRNRQVRVKVERRDKTTPYEGLALAHNLTMRMGLDRDIDRSVPLPKVNLPYYESDPILFGTVTVHGPRPVPEGPLRIARRFNAGIKDVHREPEPPRDD